MIECDWCDGTGLTPSTENQCPNCEGKGMLVPDAEDLNSESRLHRLRSQAHPKMGAAVTGARVITQAK